MDAVTTDVAATQIAWNETARAEALAEFGVLSPDEIRGGPHATARLLAHRELFAVDGPDVPLFPAFQFAKGEPLPVIARVLEALADEVQGWDILLWFTGSSGYLDGARPVDRLADAPDDVVAAAAHQASLSED